MLAVSAGALAANAEPSPAPTGDVHASPEVEARAKVLEAQLMAPCCDHQTLDVHQSPPASAMRAEIRSRLASGESEEEILSAFQQRYGPKIIAVRSMGEVNALGGTLLFLSAAGAIGAALTIRRWRRRSDRQAAEAAKKARRPPKDDAWDRRLDAELAALDDAALEE